MNILILPDLHLTEKNFDNRKDDLAKVSLRKFNFIYETADKYNVDCLLQAGDFTDASTLSWKFFNKLKEAITRLTISIHGQHSLRYRTKGNTVLDALEHWHEKMVLLSDGEYYPMTNDNVRIYGAGYNEEIPTPKEGKYNILLIHKMIVDKKIWDAQQDHSFAQNFLRRNKFDLIISGDNHAQFETTIDNSIGNRFLFNCGTLIRDGINYIDYKPYVILFNTKTYKWRKIFVPIEKSEVVFDIDKIESEKNRDTDIEKFVSGIKNYRNMGLDFHKNLVDYMKENNVSRSVKLVFEKAFTKIGEEKRND